ncbi:hypothetical protein MBM_04506 [Drepanopeziza brunnea f. sp. 'multigermtubi' MB_m1]|uniref:Uncharacterized protein n=1 Tax=Marssonina brunnea f. sp. multigermtubi (strain MB_m1) TaxID=1072389 RepID=K1XW08_MARBU|nr:uncharacterized protein MBM_04506 [Drepanopeziza brunnea f. sp. 'multigermtubi' MB_m1]EKD16929.1 hypothetical protein MBM_04506 [Drepanopeziza brunnea f. sp. 'multigermtubi' MB_m1]
MSLRWTSRVRRRANTRLSVVLWEEYYGTRVERLLWYGKWGNNGRFGSMLVCKAPVLADPEMDMQNLRFRRADMHWGVSGDLVGAVTQWIEGRDMETRDFLARPKVGFVALRGELLDDNDERESIWIKWSEEASTLMLTSIKNWEQKENLTLPNLLGLNVKVYE